MRATIFIVGISFLTILLFLANPFGLWTPMEWQYLAVAALAVVGVIFAGMVFKDASGDEREEALRNNAARSGYLAGMLVLTAGIVATAVMEEHQNLWVLGTLAAMVIARLVTRSLTE